MQPEVDFDLLSRRTMESNVDLAIFSNLFGHVFALPEWHFIARGEFPDINPYVASNAAIADGKYMIRAFTDTARLDRFAEENQLKDADGNVLILSIPTANIIPYLEGSIEHGVYGIWFNSDTQSEGFFTPLTQLRVIKAHLEKVNWKASSDEAGASPNQL